MRVKLRGAALGAGMALMCAWQPVSSVPMVADSQLSPGEEYSVVHCVDFPYAPQTMNFPATAGWVGAHGVGRGLFARGTDPDSGNHYMYYALPKGYVDNTYGSTGNDVPPIVGIYEGSSGHRLGTGLICSDNFGTERFDRPRWAEGLSAVHC